MAVAAGTAHIAKHYANGRIGIARLHPQVQIGHAVATIARDEDPGMLCGEGSGNLRPEPCRPVCGNLGIERLDNQRRLALGLPGALHRFNGFDFVRARTEGGIVRAWAARLIYWMKA